MEAMAMGRPVITTDMPGARDAVTDGQSGLVVQAGDRPALIAACRRFITHPGLAASMGAAARSEALRRYDLPRSTALQAAVILGDGDFGKRCVAL
jgi:glycosyltransferase involved in cell wall biosynthesis